MRRVVAVVNYGTANLARQAVRRVESTWSQRGPNDCLLVIDNTEPSAGLTDVEGTSALLQAGMGNLGYAGAVNHVARQAGDAFLVLNADVMVEEACVDGLFAALESGASVAGPMLFWNPTLTVKLPPAQDPRLSGQLADCLSQRHALFAAVFRRTFRRQASRHWSAESTLSSWRLSGAALAIRCSAFEDVGSFDEGFRLYYEETDWLLRARQRGHRAHYVPKARAVHLYDQSPASQACAKERLFDRSAERFRRRHLPRSRRLLEVAAGRPIGEWPAACDEAAINQPPPPGAVAVEWSSRPCGFPMARSEIVQACLPDDVQLGQQSTPLYRRYLGSSGQEMP